MPNTIISWNGYHLEHHTYGPLNFGTDLYSLFTVQSDKLTNVANVNAGKKKKSKKQQHGGKGGRKKQKMRKGL